VSAMSSDLGSRCLRGEDSVGICYGVRDSREFQSWLDIGHLASQVVYVPLDVEM